MNKIKNILSVKSHLLNIWGLNDNPPFRGVPSGDIDELMRVFVNREKEIERALLTLDDGENVLVRGMTGIGKTSFIMAVLHLMNQHSKAIGQEILPIHIRQFVGGTREEFFRAILYSLANKLSPRNKRAREIVYALTGEEITRGRSRGLSASLEVQVPQLLAAKTQGDIGSEASHVLKIDYPEHFLVVGQT